MSADTSSSSMKFLGAALRQFREQKGVSIEDMAKEAGLGPRFVLEVEKGKDTARIGKVLDLAKAFGLTLKLMAMDEESADPGQVDETPPERSYKFGQLVELPGRMEFEAGGEDLGGVVGGSGGFETAMFRVLCPPFLHKYRGWCIWVTRLRGEPLMVSCRDVRPYSNASTK